jgi:alpha-1,6-mannosyltransferase
VLSRIATFALKEFLPLRKGKSRAQRHTIAIYLFVFAGVVFRAEVALLLFTQLAIEMLQSRITLGTIMPAGIKSAILALAISVPIDSYLWRRPVWPELAGFYYNAIQGKSSDWGVSPYSHYMTSILPKLLLNPIIPIVLLPLGFALPATNQLTLNLITPSLLFISIYSLQPHKEARFIIYVIPPLIAAASLSATYIWKQRMKSLLYRLASLLIIFSIAASFAASTTMLLISSLNYPGGSALSQLHIILDSRPGSRYPPIREWDDDLYIHMDVLSCMTGVTQFQQYPSPGSTAAWKGPGLPYLGGRRTKVSYDKTEDPQTLADPAFWDKMDYALMEEPGRAIGRWIEVGIVWGYAGIEILRPGQVSGSGDPLEKVYAANNGTKISGEVRSGEDVREAVKSVPFDGNGGEKVTFEELKNRLLDGNAGRDEVLGVVRDAVRLVTGGWWVGPKMEPKLRILRNLRERAGPGTIS